MLKTGYIAKNSGLRQKNWKFDKKNMDYQSLLLAKSNKNPFYYISFF